MTALLLLIGVVASIVAYRRGEAAGSRLAERATHVYLDLYARALIAHGVPLDTLVAANMALAEAMAPRPAEEALQ